MRIAIDLDSGDVRSWAGQAVTGLRIKRGDRLPVEVRFTRNGATIERPSGATGKLGIKSAGDLDGDFVAFAGSWTKTGSGSQTVYTFDLQTNTTELHALFSAEPASVSLVMEIESIAPGELRSSATVAVTVENDVIRGDEGVPTDALDPYPLPAEIVKVADINDTVIGTDAMGAFGETLLGTETKAEAGAAFYDYRTTAFTAANGGKYVCAGTFAVTNPATGAAGQAYQVIVLSGAVTINDVAFAPSRFPILVAHNGSSWQTLPQTLTGNLSLPNAAFGANNALTGALGDARYLGIFSEPETLLFAGTATANASSSAALSGYEYGMSLTMGSAVAGNYGRFNRNDFGALAAVGGSTPVNASWFLQWDQAFLFESTATYHRGLIVGTAANATTLIPGARSLGVRFTGAGAGVIFVHNGTSEFTQAFSGFPVATARARCVLSWQHATNTLIFAWRSLNSSSPALGSISTISLVQNPGAIVLSGGNATFMAEALGAVAAGGDPRYMISRPKFYPGVPVF